MFSRERRFLGSKGSSTTARAKFVVDTGMQCVVAGPEDLAQEKTEIEDVPDLEDGIKYPVDNLKRKEVDYFIGRSADPSLVPGTRYLTMHFIMQKFILVNTRPLSAKGQKIVRWIKSQQAFIENLRALEVCRVHLFKLKSDHSIFLHIAKLRVTSEYFLEQLLLAQSRDPNFELPIGLLMVDLVAVVARPFVHFCTGLDLNVKNLVKLITKENLARLEGAPEHVKNAIARVGGVSKLVSPYQHL